MENKQKFGLIILVILIVFVVVGLFYFSSNNSKNGDESVNLINNIEVEKLSTEDVVKSKNNGITIIENKNNDTVCYDNPKYFIVTHPTGIDVNDDYLIKYKKSNNQIISCKYSVETTDFEIKDKANGFISVENDFLFIETGTGPDGTYLMVYDLNNRKEVYGDVNTGVESIKDNTLTYWRPNYDSKYKTPETTKENCLEIKDYDKLNSWGLGVIMNTLISVKLSDLTKKELGKYHCSVKQ